MAVRSNSIPEQEGTTENDSISAAAAGDDGSVVLVGSTFGNWSATNKGDADYAAVKLDSDGDVMWRLQVIEHTSLPPEDRNVR